MEFFFQQLINGLSLGFVYSLIAIGYSMVYGIIGMINFSHGNIFMLSAYFGFIFFLFLSQLCGFTFSWLMLIGIILCSGLCISFWGWTIERVAYRPLRHSFRLAPLISSVGVSMILSNLVQLLQGVDNKTLPSLLNSTYVLYHSPVFDVTISSKQILTSVSTVIMLIGLWSMIKFTSFGRAQRACAEDKYMASLMGINVDKMISMTFIIGAVLASFAGNLYLLYYGVISFNDGFIPGIKAFTAAVIGGIGSLSGAVVGGLMIGLIETLWGAYFSAEYKDIATYALLILFLVLRPSGLFGKPEVVKV